MLDSNGKQRLSGELDRLLREKASKDSVQPLYNLLFAPPLTDDHKGNMMEFMRVICVILCLIISTSVPAYAESILWATKHSSTSLEKDQEWISGQMLSEQSVTAMEAIEDTASDMEDPEADPEADSEEFIDVTIVMEGMEGTESTPLEIIMDPTTPDEIQEDEGLGDGVEDATLDDGQETAAPEEDGVDEPEHPEEDGVKEDLVDEPIT